jgi:hypothetical protein
MDETAAAAAAINKGSSELEAYRTSIEWPDH